MAWSAKLVVVFLAMVVVAQMAHSQADCPSILGLSSCLTFAQGQDDAPSDTCCGVVNKPSWTADCLCNVAKSGQYNIKFDKALLLPKLCKRYVPAGTTCNGTPVPR